MGFDIYGIKPNAEVGIYFRNNVWWWRPLAEYVLDVCSDFLTEKETQYWQSNDGQRVTKETAQKIGLRLNELIACGATKRYADKYEHDRQSLPKDVCEYCNGTGDRPDLEPPEWKAKCGGCNACHGTGLVETHIAHYPFSEQNVKEFAAFCESCGGFEIW